MTIEGYLLGKKIKPIYKGFDILVEAIKLVTSNKEYQRQMSNMLYPKLAELFNGTSGQMQQAMRNAIKRTGLGITPSAFIALAVVEINEANKKGEV